MHRAAPYNRLDPTLVYDRRRCKRALARYHAACEIDSGMDDEQARRMLEKVFDPTRDESYNSRSPPDRRGILGHKVRIEPGFSCTYGYNLVMMDSVYVGDNTSIDDSAKVEIGPRTTIGNDVKIITSAYVKDLIDRKGSGGLWTAKEVFIGANVIIEDNVTIYPDVRIENGVIVEHGAIVKESLPANTVLQAHGGHRPPY
jgi:acetyltransferase-like isoleucine patch superfamily enzyme